MFIYSREIISVLPENTVKHICQFRWQYTEVSLVKGDVSYSNIRDIKIQCKFLE